MGWCIDCNIENDPRGNFLSIEWKKECLERDNYTCQDCGATNHYYEASKTCDNWDNYWRCLDDYERYHNVKRNLAKAKSHNHTFIIKSFLYHPSHRYDVDNGRTLCQVCHMSYPKETSFEIIIRKARGKGAPLNL